MIQQYLPTEDTIVASLVVENIGTTLNKTQKDSVNYIQYYDETEDPPITALDVKLYSITNLPNNFARVPKHSIFSAITCIPTDTPDMRHVYVNHKESDSVFNRLQVSTNVMKGSNLNFFNSRTSSSNTSETKNSIFTNDVPIASRIFQNAVGNLTDSPEFDGIANNPQSITKAKMIDVLGDSLHAALLTKIATERIKTPDETEDIIDVTMNVLSNLKHISRKTIVSTIDNTNTHMNKDTVKIGMIMKFMSSLQTDARHPNEIVMNDAIKREIALEVDKRVDAYYERVKNNY